MTKHEKIVWELLKENSILGLKFRRQHPINNYIADFYCHKVKLVVEIDGESHRNAASKEYDENRTNVINNFNIEVIRFNNEDVTHNLPYVKRIIELKCLELLNEINTQPISPLS
jgi:very-short-patch-repair endonuclease